MPKVIYVSAAGVSTEVDAPVGTTVMGAALKNGVEGILAECGGVCMCSTCHVFVDEKVSWINSSGAGYRGSSFGNCRD